MGGGRRLRAHVGDRARGRLGYPPVGAEQGLTGADRPNVSLRPLEDPCGPRRGSRTESARGQA